MITTTETEAMPAEPPKEAIKQAPEEIKDPEKKPITPLQYVWFAGHVLILIGTSLDIVAYATFKGHQPVGQILYRMTFVSVVITYGLSIRKKLNGQIPSFYGLLPLESFQYGAIGMLWLFSKGHLLKLIPFFAFSALQVAFFTSSRLLSGNGLANKFEGFVKDYSKGIQRFVGYSDLLLFARLLLDVIMIVPGSMLCVIVYAVFLRIRFEYATHAQEALQDLESVIDKYANKSTTNPKVTEYWKRVKDALKSHPTYSFNPDKIKKQKAKQQLPKAKPQVTRKGSNSGLFLDEEPINLPASTAATDTATSTATSRNA